MKRKQTFCRWLFYIIGLLILALGITLNTKTGLGVSPIISVSFCASVLLGTNFGDMTFVWYGVFVVVEIVLHTAMSKRGEGCGKYHVADLKKAILADVLQFPLCLVFTRFLNIFAALIPEFETECAGTFAGSFAGRILFLILAIILTGIGAVLSLDMRIIPNPGDGIVQALSDFSGKDVGFCKNCFDAFNISLTIASGLLFRGHLIGIGIGTVMAVIGVGRVMALFNYCLLKPVSRASGL